MSVEPKSLADRKRALRLGAGALCVSLAFFFGGSWLANLVGETTQSLRIRSGLGVLMTIVSLGGLIFAVRKLSVARDRSWDFMGWAAVLLLIPGWLLIVLFATFCAMALNVAVTGQRLGISPR